jgi:hypothetical protein
MAQFEGVWDGAPIGSPDYTNVILDADCGQIVLIGGGGTKKVLLNPGDRKLSEPQRI